MQSEKRRWKKAPTPEEVGGEAIQRGDWFSAFSDAVALFEHWGYSRLPLYCTKENIHVEEKINTEVWVQTWALTYITPPIGLFCEINQGNRLSARNSAEYGLFRF